MPIKLPINYEEAHWSVRKQARERYVEIQEGKCCHCGNLLNGSPTQSVVWKKINRKLFPKNFFMWPTHLHHCRKTGMSIGAVHNTCNAVLWQYHGE